MIIFHQNDCTEGLCGRHTTHRAGLQECSPQAFCSDTSCSQLPIRAFLATASSRHHGIRDPASPFTLITRPTLPTPCQRATTPLLTNLPPTIILRKSAAYKPESGRRTKARQPDSTLCSLFNLICLTSIWCGQHRRSALPT